MKHLPIALLLSMLSAVAPLAAASTDSELAGESTEKHYTYTLTLLGEPVNFSLPAPSGEWLQQALEREAEQSRAATATSSD